MEATRQSWPNLKPLPEQSAQLFLNRQFTQDEYDLIGEGLIPEAMEDKWFIFLEDDVVYLHRSWTGFCIYQVSLAKDGANYAVAKALVNREPNQYAATDDRYDEKLLTFLIDNFLFGKSSLFTMPVGVAKANAIGLFHHQVAEVGPKARDKTATITVRSSLSWLRGWIKWVIK